MTARHRGFTLVELLVVISIIALLVAFLLPALAAARKAARIALCGSQLRQNGIGLNAYQVDSAGYYPLFGGDLGINGGRLISYGDGWDGDAPWRFNTAIFNKFGSYIGLSTIAGVDPMHSLFSIKYCPVVDWFHSGAYSFIRPDGYGADYAIGMPGYCYFTGRMMNGSTWLNFNTIKRRDNPREILMADQLMQATQTEPPYPDTIVDATVASWFNPHYDRSCTPLPQGSANELGSDGHVVNVQFTGTTRLMGWYGVAYFEGVHVGNEFDAMMGQPYDSGSPNDYTYGMTP